MKYRPFSSDWTVYKTLDLVVPPLISLVISYGWFWSISEVGVGWLIRRQKRWVDGGIYLTVVNTLFPCLLALFLHLWRLPFDHGVPVYTLPVKEDITMPYECVDMSGDLSVCLKDSCDGTWKPPRTHHCALCGVCRLEFDHHCPWVGNCMTRTVFKPFLCFLYLTPITVVVVLSPIIHRLAQHISEALAISRGDPWVIKHWWDWPGSWIVIGGPGGRWIGGTLLGFRILRLSRPQKESLFSGDVIEYPHLRVLLLSMIGAMFTFFAICVAAFTTRNVLYGQTTLDTLRPRHEHGQRYLCVPNSVETSCTSSHQTTAIPSQGVEGRTRSYRVMVVLPQERLYDLGWRENWRTVMSAPLFGGNKSSSVDFVWPTLNPVILRRLREKSR